MIQAQLSRANEGLKLQAGGAVKPKSVYIERPEDRSVYELLAHGEYCNILTSRQMGKTSLRTRVGRKLRDAGVRVASVDLSALSAGHVANGDARLNSSFKRLLRSSSSLFRRKRATPEAPQSHPAEPNDWFKSLFSTLAAELGVSFDVHAWWSATPDVTAGARVVRFCEEVLVDPVRRTVIFLDEVDATLALPFTDHLYTSIRYIYNTRADSSDLERLGFCLMGVLTPDELIKARRTTPYNVGRTIELTDFDPGRDDLTPLATALVQSGRDSQAIVEKTFEWTRGQPFLTMALALRATELGTNDVDEIVKSELGHSTAPLFNVHFARIEQILRTRLRHPTAALRLYGDLLNERPVNVEHSDDIDVLKLAGIVRRTEDGSLAVRNRLYARRFNEAWLLSVLARRIPKWVYYTLAASIVIALFAVLIVLWQNESIRRLRADQQRLDDAAKAEFREGVADMSGHDFAEGYRKLPASVRQPQRDLVDYLTKRSKKFQEASNAWRAARCFEEALLLEAFAWERKPDRALAKKLDVATRVDRWLMSDKVDVAKPDVTVCEARKTSRCTAARALSNGATVASCATGIYIARPKEQGGEFQTLGTGRLSAFSVSQSGRWLVGLTPESVLVWKDLDAIERRIERRLKPNFATCQTVNAFDLAEGTAPEQPSAIVVGCDEGTAIEIRLGHDWAATLDRASGLTEPGKRVPLNIVSERHTIGGRYQAVQGVLALEPGSYVLATRAGAVLWRPERGYEPFGPSEGAFAVDRLGDRIAIAYASSVSVFGLKNGDTPPVEIQHTPKYPTGEFLSVAWNGDDGVCAAGLRYGAGGGAGTGLLACSPVAKDRFSNWKETSLGDEPYLGTLQAIGDGILLAANGRARTVPAPGAPTSTEEKQKSFLTSVERALGLELTPDERWIVRSGQTAPTVPPLDRAAIERGMSGLEGVREPSNDAGKPRGG